jgi:hypothetical protein
MSNERSRAENVALLAKLIASDPSLKTLVKEYLDKTQSMVEDAQALNAKSVMTITDQQFTRFAAFTAGQLELVKMLNNEVFHPVKNAALSTTTGSDLI